MKASILRVCGKIWRKEVAETTEPYNQQREQGEEAGVAKKWQELRQNHTTSWRRMQGEDAGAVKALIE